MTFTDIVIGSLSWGNPVNDAFSSQDARITALESSGGTAMDFGLKSWSFDPATAAAGVTPTSGTVVMAKLYFPAGTVSAVGVSINAAGVGLTAGQNFMGVYNQAGTRLGVTADQTVSWATGGYKQIPLVAPIVIAAPGFYYVAFLSNGATPASITRGSNNTSSTTVVNLNLTAAEARFANGPAAQTTLPASITMASRTPTSQAYWMTVA